VTTDRAREPLRVASAASGAAFALLALIAFLLALGPDDTSGEGILRYYVENDAAVKWQAMLFGVSAIGFLWFFGTFVRNLGAADKARRYSGVILASTGATGALYFVGISGWLALAYSFGDASGVAGAAPFAFGDAAVMWNISDAAFTLSNFPAATLLLAAAFVILESPLLPAWSAVAAAVVGAFLIVQGAAQIVADADFLDTAGIVAFVAFVVWVFVVSVLLTRAVMRSEAVTS
jgi:hypothetical protein